MTILALCVLAVVLAGPVPRLMARQLRFRRSPRAALIVWQSVSLAAVAAAVAAAPLLAARQPGRPLMVVAVLISGLVLGRLLLSGHRVGTRLRSLRRRHRELVDLLATSAPDTLRVLAHPTPMAYCLPGFRRRVVLSQGVLDALPADQLAGVLAHERAHLRARHDLVLEFFTVLHEAVPSGWRSAAAMAEVRLLVEVLADRVAVRAVGRLPVARALVALASASSPEAAMAAGGSTARARLALLAAPEQPPWWMTPTMYAFALAVLAAPAGLAALALAGLG